MRLPTATPSTPITNLKRSNGNFFQPFIRITDFVPICTKLVLEPGFRQMYQFGTNWYMIGMRMPRTPPPIEKIITPEFFGRVYKAFAGRPRNNEYLHWDELRRKPAPENLSHEEWWAWTKFTRSAGYKYLPLLDSHGEPFAFALTDVATQRLHEIDMGGGGHLAMPAPIANTHTRNQYLVSSLINEAITSSQLEGAVTTREVAKEMLRTGRKPMDRSERMILNNYLTMRRIIDLKTTPLSHDLIFEIHRSVADGTMNDASAAGRFRTPAESVRVENSAGEVFHLPPPAGELPERMERMCAFANGQSPGHFVHPVVRAILLHLWLAYDHPFVDGNGRTARALFYWSMLNNGYWLFEYISISDILLKSPKAYHLAFLYTETDGNDATYFINYHLEVIHQAIENLRSYIARKTQELEQCEPLLHAWDGLNHRQIALINHALRHPGTVYTVEGHQSSHNTAYDTARTDLLKLAELGLLTKGRAGRTMTFRAPPHLTEVIREGRQENVATPSTDPIA